MTRLTLRRVFGRGFESAVVRDGHGNTNPFAFSARLEKGRSLSLILENKPQKRVCRTASFGKVAVQAVVWPAVTCMAVNASFSEMMAPTFAA